jgi:cell division protein FtsB
MRFFIVVLAAALVLLQYRLWLSDQGMREVVRLQAAVDAQQAENRVQGERNRQLAAEVADLKGGGLSALEERARTELGMVGSAETFYQVVSGTPPATHVATVVTGAAHAGGARAPAASVTARAN